MGGCTDWGCGGCAERLNCYLFSTHDMDLHALPHQIRFDLINSCQLQYSLIALPVDFYFASPAAIKMLRQGQLSRQLSSSPLSLNVHDLVPLFLDAKRFFFPLTNCR